MTQTTKPSRRAPQRTCVVCREVKDKRDLTRIVRLPDGKVSIDPRGRMAGRGAYICASLACWQACLNGNRLDYVLKTKIAPGERERLLAEGRSLIGGG
jgi:predicted RNA-binding protein YlxR (DUF448 family)